MPWASSLVAVALCSVSWLAWNQVGHPLETAAAVAVGARDNWALSVGESWRLISAGFIHYDTAHLLWNLVPSVPILIVLEWHLGGRAVLALTALGLTLGHAVGAVFYGGVSVGFSPALFAIIAAFAVTQWQRKPRLALFSIVYLAIGIIASLRFAGVDLASHIGGMAAGTFGGLIWLGGFGAKGLALAAALPLISGLPLMQVAPATWSLPKQGLVLAIDGSWHMTNEGAKRCTPSRSACITVSTQTASRLDHLTPWATRCAEALGPIQATHCMVARADALCRVERRGLYEHTICLHSQLPAGLTRWHAVVQSLRLTSPKDQPKARPSLLRALSAHRLGQTVRARSAYAEAMLEHPDDARLPFLAAILELDFGAGPRAAEPLALHATALDPLHPDGKALLHEIRAGMEP